MGYRRPMHRKILPLVLGFLGLAAHAAPPVAFEDPGRRAKLAAAYPEVDRVMREFVARENVPGAAWGIVVDGELAHVGTVGLRDVEAAQPVQGDSVFRIASMTKSFTAMAVLKLRDQGKLSLDDPVERYVPELRGLRPLSGDAPRISAENSCSVMPSCWSPQGLSSGKPADIVSRWRSVMRSKRTSRRCNSGR